MSNADKMPGKIYAELDECLKGTCFGDWSDDRESVYGLKNGVEYIRADLVQAQLDEAWRDGQIGNPPPDAAIQLIRGTE